VIASLLGELEVEARSRALELEAARRLPRGFVAQHYPATTRSGLVPLVPLEPQQPIPAWAWRGLEERYPGGDRLLAALLLAGDVRAAEALLLGDDVPEHRLDPVTLRLVSA
jgi:hypothetical protein